MNWQFSFTEGTKKFNLKAEITWATYQIEDIKVTGEGVSVVLQNNRPLLVAIESKLPVTWRVIHGKIENPALLARIKKELENHLKRSVVKPIQTLVKKAERA